MVLFYLLVLQLARLWLSLLDLVSFCRNKTILLDCNRTASSGWHSPGSGPGLAPSYPHPALLPVPATRPHTRRRVQNGTRPALGQVCETRWVPIWPGLAAARHEIAGEGRGATGEEASAATLALDGTMREVARAAGGSRSRGCRMRCCSHQRGLACAAGDSRKGPLRAAERGCGARRREVARGAEEGPAAVGSEKGMSG
jgi:hypothetical protein